MWIIFQVRRDRGVGGKAKAKSVISLNERAQTGRPSKHVLVLRRTIASKRPDETLGNLGAPGKSFRAKRLYDVDARGACRREHRSDYRRA